MASPAHQPTVAETGGAYEPAHPMSKPLHAVVADLLAVRDAVRDSLAVSEDGRRAAARAWVDVRPAAEETVAAGLPDRRGASQKFHDAPPVRQRDYVLARERMLAAYGMSAMTERSLLLGAVAAYDSFVAGLFRSEPCATCNRASCEALSATSSTRT